jgi:hypothetical protein
MLDAAEKLLLETPVILTPIPDKLTPYVRSFVSGM